jgi:hypothetical protein
MSCGHHDGRRGKMHRKALGTAVALVLAVAGCGSSGPLSRADLAKRGTDICNRRNVAVRAVLARHRGLSRAGVEEALPLLEKATQELAALDAPSELKPKLAAFTGWERGQLRRIRDAQHGRHDRYFTSAQLRAHATLRTELGLRTCL